MGVNKKICAILSGAGLALLMATPALACSCKPMSRDQVIASTPIVFEGRVLRVRHERGRVYADIETGRILKGSVPRVVEVGTANNSAACGYPFKAGQRLTIGAYLSQQMFSASSCAMDALNRR